VPAAWRPTASLEILRLRARVLADLRDFFARRSMLEVETPVLSQAGNCDPHLHSLMTACTGADELAALYYLHTSPEFAMKRLLAAGSGSIYQIARVFRDGERGSWHNPEFTLVEWYRVGFDHHRLMEELEALLSQVLGTASCRRSSYADIFQAYVELDPHHASLAELHRHTARLGLGFSPHACQDRDDYLNLILSHSIAPKLGWDRPTFIYDFPASQAALARIRAGDPPLAERFELFIHGMEIANGFHELGDHIEQRRRFGAELAKRHQLGLPELPMDERLLAALEHGLPDCAGVALGFDRLLMAMTGAGDIAEVLAFPIERA
jgi:elongation factor P--(R)-beta-lysine ligase